MLAKSREAVTRPGSPQSPVLPCDPSLPTCLLHLLESHGGATCAASLPAVPAWPGTHPWVHPCSHTGQCRRSLCRCPVGLPSPARMVRVPVSCRPPEMSFRTLRTSGQIFGFPTEPASGPHFLTSGFCSVGCCPVRVPPLFPRCCLSSCYCRGQEMGSPPTAGPAHVSSLRVAGRSLCSPGDLRT